MSGEWPVASSVKARRPIESYEDLEVWQLAMALAEMVYDLANQLPRDEQFGMTAQVKRAAVSIPSNIAEGFGRDGTASFIQFLRIALGSSRELETQILLASRLKMVDAKRAQDVRDCTIRVSKMLRALIRKLEERRS